MGILAAFTTLIGLLPELIALTKTFATWINKVSGNDPKGFIKKVGEAMSTLNSAQTEKERIEAAKGIAGIIAGL